MMTSSTLYIDPLHVHLAISTSKGFIDHFGFMERIKKFKFKFKKGLFSFSHTSNNKCVLPGNIYFASWIVKVDFGGRAVEGVGLWPLACGDCRFESRWGNGCLL
jgi:hypothetical protein